ncbi:hypothetical protein [Sphingobacterium athyrii]|uniref:Lipoprotein n=1 Tax=Sphingobacterium athyrii TaxID=2152717 RepID=A0A363NTM6_9SPHI|nr:hypothetical protein [Sphingobacterium athyrii]PUV24119.1 hypothetical protein DCO56_12165 [Sphingobacterium athyrii]
MKNIISVILVSLLFTACATKSKIYSYGASYTFWYTTTFKEAEEYYKKDSVTVSGRVIQPNDITQVVSVNFRSAGQSIYEKDKTAYCDRKGKFSIKLKRSSYDIFVSSPSISTGFFIDKLGLLGDSVIIEIYPQKQVMSRFFTYE